MTHLNKIQQVCTNLNDEPEFVMGHVYGMRQWFLLDAQDGPHLYGHNDFKWSLTEPSQATCELSYWTVYQRVTVSREAMSILRYELNKRIHQMFKENPNSSFVSVTLEGSNTELQVPRTTFMREQRLDHPWLQFPDTSYGLGFFFQFTLKAFTPIEAHNVTDPRCTCGFYAYTSPEALYENSKRRADSYFGIVKAWGKVTQGTKGFRAEKAQIVGLTPAMSKMTVLRYDQTINMRKTQLTEDGFKTSYEDLPIPSWQWVRSDTVPPTEARLIPAGFPRYSSMDEMFTAYQRLTGNDS